MPDSSQKRPFPFLLLAVGVLVALGFIFWLWNRDLERRLPDFAQFEVGEARKNAFFSYLEPLVREELIRVQDERRRVLRVLQQVELGETPDPELLREVDDIARRYHAFPGNLLEPEVLARLLRRVDEIPVAIVLAQAALESGWGTSRIAQRGNNLFGITCFRPGCGLIPQPRGVGLSYEMAVFSSPQEGIRYYLLNLNRHPAYKDFRMERERQRLEGGEPDPWALAGALRLYSTERDEYVEKVRLVMRSNGLVSL